MNGQGTSYGEDESFTSSLAVPGLTTKPPTNIQAESATLNGSLIGDGEPTKYYFEWGTTPSYGEKTPTTESAGSPNGPPVALSFDLTHLKPGSTYHYRIVATDGFGTDYGEDQTLETVPLAPLVTESLSGVQSDLAFLHARINPGGGETTYHFEYATQEEYEVNHTYENTIPIPDGSAGSGYLYQRVSVQLSDLKPGTTYHWRVVAQNSTETTFGGDRTFTTYAFSPFNDACPNAHIRQQTGAASLLDCRAYELVSAANTGGYNVESNLTEGQTPYAGYPEAESPSNPKASARFSTPSTTVASRAPTTRPIAAPTPTSRPAAKTAGRPNTSASPPTTPSRLRPSPRSPPAPTRASKPSPTAPLAAARPALRAATPASRSASKASWSRAWRAPKIPAPRPNPPATSPRTSPPTANTSSSAPSPNSSPTATKAAICDL